MLLASKPRLIFRLSCECGVKYYTDAILLGGAAVNRCDLALLFAWITEDNDAYFKIAPNGFASKQSTLTDRESC